MLIKRQSEALNCSLTEVRERISFLLSQTLVALKWRFDFSGSASSNVVSLHNTPAMQNMPAGVRPAMQKSQIQKRQISVFQLLAARTSYLTI